MAAVIIGPDWDQAVKFSLQFRGELLQSPAANLINYNLLAGKPGKTLMTKEIDILALPKKCPQIIKSQWNE